MLPLEKIIYPTDFSKAAGEGIEIVKELAEQFSAEILLIHVIVYSPNLSGGVSPLSIHMTSALKEIQKSAENSLDKVREEKIPKDLSARNFVIQGNAADEIVGLAAEENAQTTSI